MKSKKNKSVVRTRGSTRGKILAMIRTQRTVGGGELTRELGVTRQALNLHIRTMLKERLIWKEGVTRAAVYHPGAGPQKKAAPRKAKPAAAKKASAPRTARAARKPAPARGKKTVSRRAAPSRRR